jgi:hypothetical protein
MSTHHRLPAQTLQELSRHGIIQFRVSLAAETLTLVILEEDQSEEVSQKFYRVSFFAKASDRQNRSCAASLLVFGLVT